MGERFTTLMKYLGCIEIEEVCEREGARDQSDRYIHIYKCAVIESMKKERPVGCEFSRVEPSNPFSDRHSHNIHFYPQSENGVERGARTCEQSSDDFNKLGIFEKTETN